LMGNRGSLRLTLLNSRGEPLAEQVEIRLRNLSITDNRVASALASQPIVIPDLQAAPNGLYEVEVFPAKSEIEGRFVNIGPDAVTDLSIVFHPCDKDDRHPPPPPPPPQGCPPPKIPDQLDEQALTAELAVRMAGTPADGTASPNAAQKKVIWVEQGDEVLVHLDSTRARILNGAVLVSIDLETDQTGRTPLVATFAVGRPDDPAGLVAVTDEFPRGNGILASRWGAAFQAAAWASLLGLSTDHATERAAAPRGIAATLGTLSLQAGPPLKVAQ
jgi:hypothetical protein